MLVTLLLDRDEFEFELADSELIDELLQEKHLKVAMRDHFGREYRGKLATVLTGDDLITRQYVPGHLYFMPDTNELILPYEPMKKLANGVVNLGAATDLAAFVAYLDDEDQETVLQIKTK